MITNCCQSQMNTITVSTHVTLEYVSARRDLWFQTLNISEDKKYLIKDDEYNTSLLIDKKSFDCLSDFIIKNNNKFANLMLARKKGSCFEICLFSDNNIIAKYYVFSKGAYQYFKKLVSVFQKNKIDNYLISILQSRLESSLFSNMRK
jgi:hypothetical protein